MSQKGLLRIKESILQYQVYNRTLFAQRNTMQLNLKITFMLPSYPTSGVQGY
jgi:hypothetical protein